MVVSETLADAWAAEAQSVTVRLAKFVGGAEPVDSARITCAHALRWFGSADELIAAAYPKRSRLPAGMWILIGWNALFLAISLWSVAVGSGRGGEVVLLTSVVIVGAGIGGGVQRDRAMREADRRVKACWVLRGRVERVVSDLEPLVRSIEAGEVERGRVVTVATAANQLAAVLDRPWSRLESPRWKDHVGHDHLADVGAQLTVLRPLRDETQPIEDAEEALTSSPLGCTELGWYVNTNNQRRQWIIYDGSQRPVGSIEVEGPGPSMGRRLARALILDDFKSWAQQRHLLIDSDGRTLCRVGGGGRHGSRITSPDDMPIVSRVASSRRGCFGWELRDPSGVAVLHIEKQPPRLLDAEGNVVATLGRRGSRRSCTIHAAMDDPRRLLIVVAALFSDGVPQPYDPPLPS